MYAGALAFSLSVDDTRQVCPARSSTEMLEADEKFFCNSCRCLQEAQKRMKIATLPRVLCLHLKRFKYIEQLDRWGLLWPPPEQCLIETHINSAESKAIGDEELCIAQCVAPEKEMCYPRP